MTTQPKPLLTFESQIKVIDDEIYKRKNKWSLTSLAWLSFEDVAQILRIHIYKKWDHYDQTRSLVKWINRVITNQIKNLVRNNHGNYARPCLRCAADEGNYHCRIYGMQCSACPIYNNWEKSKKLAYDIKIPLPMENNLQEVHSKVAEDLDVDVTAKNIHAYMLGKLKPLEAKVYQLLYIDHLSEIEIAKIMGYKTNEQGRNPGYKRIKNIKTEIIKTVKQGLYDGTINIVNHSNIYGSQ